jgi:hypothetical protein
MAYCGDRDTAGRGFQFNSMVQVYPEVMFKTSVSLSESTRLRIRFFKKTHLINRGQKF